jgi:tRNA nucleotidyltransferase (CCA-adding enzyme)
MPDYVYFLENRLSPDQQNALNQVRGAAREAGMNVFLTGGAVRDLTSGSPVRDLDFSVQGNALKLKKALEKQGAAFWGEHEPSQTLFLRFPGGARVEVSAIRQEEHPKPGKVVYHPATILEDLRRRDFTANAMALSLNEGSYGLLMDPLNGVADIESRLLRLVSNYGFIEEPVRMIRATRLLARLGWEMDEKTQTRFQNARSEGMISALSAYHRGYELQEIGHEEDGLKILKVLEAEGWMKALDPAWTSAGADVAGLDQLREVQGQLQMQGVNPDTSAAQMELLTARLPEKDVAALKKLFVRQGFVREWERLESEAKEFAKVLTSKQASSPSEIWKLFTTSNAEAILWLGLTSKSGAVQAKYNNFFNVWPESRQKIPYALLQEMRITPELPGYQDLLKQIFLQLIDGGLDTDDKMRAFLEPFSPPAPPPPVSIRRTRGKKGAGARARADVDDEDEDDARGARRGDDEDKDDADDDDSGDEHPLRLAPAAGPIEIAPEAAESVPEPLIDSGNEDEPEPAPEPPAPAVTTPAPKAEKSAAKPPAPVVATKPVPAPKTVKTPAPAKVPVPAKPPAKAPEVAKKPAPAKKPAKAATKTAPQRSVPSKQASKLPAKAATAAPAKKPAPPVKRQAAKKPAPPAKKTVPAKATPKAERNPRRRRRSAKPSKAREPVCDPRQKPRSLFSSDKPVAASPSPESGLPLGLKIKPDPWLNLPTCTCTPTTPCSTAHAM